MPFAVASAVGSIFGGAETSNATEDAANTQAQASEQAAQLQEQEAANTLAFQKQVYNNTKTSLQPDVNTGQSVGLTRFGGPPEAFSRGAPDAEDPPTIFT